VKVERLEPRPVLRRVDLTDAQDDTQALKGAAVAEHQPLLLARLREELEGQGLAVLDEVSALKLPTGFGQELVCDLQAGAVLAPPIGDGQAIGALKHLRFDVCSIGGKQCSFPGVCGPAMRGELRALEVALRARIDAVKQAAIDPFGVEEMDEGAAHARVGENG